MPVSILEQVSGPISASAAGTILLPSYASGGSASGASLSAVSASVGSEWDTGNGLDSKAEQPESVASASAIEEQAHVVSVGAVHTSSSTGKGLKKVKAHGGFVSLE